MSSFLLSCHIINNWVCWWRQTAQNAWKRSVFLREQPTSSSTENAMDSVWQSSLWFHSISSPRAPADLSGHIQGCCGKGALPRAPGWEHLMRTPRSCHSSTAPLLHPWGGKCLSLSVPGHLWDAAPGMWWGLEAWGCTQNTGAAPACGDRAASLPKGWKLTVGTDIRAGRAGEKELSLNSLRQSPFSWPISTSSMAGGCKHHTGILTKLPGVPTSSTLHTASFPSAVCPDVQGILLLFWLTSVFSSIVYRDGVFIMNTIVLVVE